MGTVKIVSAWPATGKSTLALQYLFINYRERKPNELETVDWVMDLDSAISKSYFPQAAWATGYVGMIEFFYQDGLDDGGRTMLLVSSHNQVQEKLLQLGLPFTIVMPTYNMRRSYIKSMYDRAVCGTDGDRAAYNYMSENFYASYRQALQMHEDHKDAITMIKLDKEHRYLSDIYDRLWE